MTDKKPKILELLNGCEHDGSYIPVSEVKKLLVTAENKGKLAVLEILEKEETLELLANLEHEQWVKWSQTLAEKEKLSKERMIRWKSLWYPYSELTELNKDFDRDWAKVVVERLKSQIKEKGKK